jgi:hypothetical protein
VLYPVERWFDAGPDRDGARDARIAEPFVVEHFHGSRIGFSSEFNVLSTGPVNAVAGGLFLYDLSAWSANIWTLSTQ